MKTSISSQTREVFRFTSLDELSFEIKFETDFSLYSDMGDSQLNFNLTFSMKGCLILSNNKKQKKLQNQRMKQTRNQILTYFI